MIKAHSAAEATFVAHLLFQLTHRPIHRYIEIDKRGRPVWVISLAEPKN
jgi:hypothetical protein